MEPFKDIFAQYQWNILTDRCNMLENAYTTRSTKTYYVHKDIQGSTLAITDSTGNTVRNYTYDAYGTPYVKIGQTYVKLKAYLSNPLFSQSTRGNDRLYTGREYDGETGLYYYRAREYSPELGRFLQRDPIGQMDQVNLYTYVGNSPVMGRDPSGCYSLGDFGDDITDFGIATVKIPAAIAILSLTVAGF